MAGDSGKRRAARATRGTRRQVQGLLPFRNWGGRRPGSGRKPKGEVAGVSHAPRVLLASRFPAHVTWKLVRGLPRLRSRREYAALCAAFRGGCDRFGFRLVHYAVLNDHLHLVVEAKDRNSLTRGLKGLAVRVAKALNKQWRRRGRVFADRYHDRVLRSPREVRVALCYVLGNGKKHERDGLQVRVATPLDMFTSGPWFDGWRERVRVSGLERELRPVSVANTWLLSVGWRRHGLLSLHEMPATG